MRRPIDSTVCAAIDPVELEARPLEVATTIPSNWCGDPRFHAFDREFVFAREWSPIAHVSQLERPGQLVCATVGGEPVLVVRGEDHQLRGFFNVCRHRGGPLAREDCRVDALQCRYHGWTYGLDGRLRGVPEGAGMQEFDRDWFGLAPVAVTEWQGLVFVHLGGSPPDPLEPRLSSIAERIAPENLARLRFARRVHYEIRCNWKVYVDNFLEGYHVPLVHPELFELLDYRSYETELYPSYSLQHSPFSSPAGGPYGTEGRAYYFFVYPNWMLNILPGRLQVNRVDALAIDRTAVWFEYYYDEVASPAALKRIEEDLAYSEVVQRQDVEICERVQTGLESRSYHRGRFSVKRESGVHHFQCLLRASYRAAVAELAGG